MITFVIKLSRWKWVLKILKRLSSINISPLDPNKEKCLNKGDAGGRFLEWKNMECSEQIGKYSTNSQLWFKDVVLISKFSSILSVFKTREHHVCVCHHFPKWKHIFFLNNDYDKLKYHSFNIVLTDSVQTFNKCFIINQLRMIYNESLLIETLYIVLKIYVLISYSFLSLHAALKHQIAHVLIRIFQVQR